jgi:hypothetical protein
MIYRRKTILYIHTYVIDARPRISLRIVRRGPPDYEKCAIAPGFYLIYTLCSVAQTTGYKTSLLTYGPGIADTQVFQVLHKPQWLTTRHINILKEFRFGSTMMKKSHSYSPMICFQDDSVDHSIYQENQDGHYRCQVIRCCDAAWLLALGHPVLKAKIREPRIDCH